MMRTENQSAVRQVCRIQSIFPFSAKTLENIDSVKENTTTIISARACDDDDVSFLQKPLFLLSMHANMIGLCFQMFPQLAQLCICMCFRSL